MKKIGVCIVTYNEEKYIAQAIESALEQKCSANVVIYIGNDCSTDGTGEICRGYAEKYPDKIILIQNPVNLGLVGNTINVLNRIAADQCEYIAMLDGDDYWCDNTKLQKQFDFLETNEDYGFVHSNQKLLFNDITFEATPRKDVKEGYIFEWAGGRETSVANCTAFYRTSLLKYFDMNDFVKYRFMSVDYAMYIVFMKYTKFHFMDDFTAVWRRGHCSVSGGGNIKKQIAYLENGIQQWKYLGDKFPEKFPYCEEQGEKFRKQHTLRLAYKYGDFKTAHDASKVSFRADNKLESIQRFCAQNRLLFNLLYTFHYKSKRHVR